MRSLCGIMWRWCLLLVSAMMIGCGGPGKPASGPSARILPADTTPKQAVDELVERILAAKGGRTADIGFSALYKSVGPEGLSTLTEHSHATIALWAAYKELLLAEQKRGAERHAVAPANLQHFRDALSRTLKPPLLGWWERVLEKAEYSPYLRGEGVQLSGEGEILFTGPIPDEPYAKSPSGFHVQSGVRVERREKKLVIAVGSEEFSIASELIARELAPDAQESELTASLTKNDCLLAIHDFDPMPFPLKVFDRRTGMLRWEARAWADGGRTAFFGVRNHFASLVANQDRVLVFGYCVGRVYVEGFDLGDGHNLFRFSSHQIYSF